MPPIKNLSIFIIAKNEGDRIGNALKAIEGLSDDVLVVDSGSIDNTIEIARSFGARVIHNDWPGYGEQKRFAEDNCRNDWLLNLDADEVVSPELRAEILHIFEKNDLQPQAFAIPIAEVFPFETKAHKFAYVLKPVRIYHRSIGRYNPSIVHDRVDLKDGTMVSGLKGIVLHYSVRSLGEQLIKLNSYADSQASDMEMRGKKYSILRLLLEFLFAFLKAYLGRKHFLRGVYGFMSAMNYAFYRYLRLAKHWERRLISKSKMDNRP
jgi:glycosyltransferase involved in cell wall biosynthesis